VHRRHPDVDATRVARPWNAGLAARAAATCLRRPVVLGAIALLLLNDHVLKRAWPGFVTGKLSDIAWPLVAVPVAGFLLAPLAGVLGRRRWRWSALAAAGVPVVVTNLSATAAAVAGDQLSALVGPSSVTRDPTDLLVLLPALAVAHRLLARTAGTAGMAASRRAERGSPISVRGGRAGHLSVGSLLVLTVATFGTFATSCDSGGQPAVLGLAVVDGALLADVNREMARSDDGGRTWSPVDDPASEVLATRGFPRVNEGEVVCGARWCYRIFEERVEASVDGATWQTIWAPDTTRTAVLERQRRGGGGCPPDLPARPLALLVEAPERSSDVVVAMGLDGALVGNAEDGLSPVAVLSVTPPSPRTVGLDAIAPELALGTVLAYLVWLFGSIGAWLQLRDPSYRRDGEATPSAAIPVVLLFTGPFVVGPLLSMLPGAPDELTYVIMMPILVMLDGPRYVALMTALLMTGPVLGWLTYRTPRSARRVPWQLAGWSLAVWLAVVAPALAWSAGLIPAQGAAIALMWLLVPATLLARRCFPWRRPRAELHEPSQR